MPQQAKSSFTLGYVQPNGQSSQRLGCGYYSLSARSNVPFIRVQGKSVDKIITWGEIVEIPFGELCAVFNASWHGGDIFVNGGCDYDNRPARITVPVPYSLSEIVPGSGLFLWTAAYPGDVRMARRAYLCFDATSPAAANSTYDVIGQRFDGSHNTTNQIPIALGYQGSGYLDSGIIPVATEIGLIPLGHMAINGDDTRPHALLTTALAFFQDNVVINGLIPPATTPNAYYIMEY